QVNFNSIILNDRFSIKGGLDINTETEVSDGTTGTFIGGDFVAEYILTEDRRFKVRFYYRSEQDLKNDTRGKTGVGLNYTRQFNTFKEFIQGMKKTVKKAGKDSG
ncbi:MAG TPA: hypothetical protein ENJ53_02315, partial [Phaeodactylibacter sp.]|nr:hypothetical protein [Phaeodactylibacter sp.]